MSFPKKMHIWHLKVQSFSLSLCVDTLLFFGEKKTQRDMAFFMRLILGNKELLGSLQETFSANTCKFDELKNED